MFKLKKIASALASVLMVGSTVGLAAAANYPAPFVSNGVADVALVYGSHAAATVDLAGVFRIQDDLNTYVTSTSGTSTIEGGDYVVLEKSADKVNIGDTVSTVFGTTVTDTYLTELLADGTYLNDENSEYDYTQKITLGSWSFNQFTDSKYNDREPSLGVKINNNDHVLNYTISFSTQPESDVSGTDLVDFETTTLDFLGKTYYVSDFDNSTTGTITLLDTANSAVVNEGETTTVTVGDKKYEVSISFISTSEVKLSVNGELTNSLQEGQSRKLSDGTYVGIKDISARDVAGTIASVEFSLGSGKLELSADGDEIELNDVIIDGVKSWVTRGTASGGKEKLKSIELEWKADGNLFIAPDSSVTIPGFESIKLSMLELVVPMEEVIDISWEGDDSMEISIPLEDGIANFNFLYANSSGEFIGLGRSATEKLVTSNTTSLSFNMTSDEWFIASYEGTSESESYLLKVSSASTPTSGINKTSISNVVTGQVACKDLTENDVCNIGSSVSLTVSSIYDDGVDHVVTLTGTGVSFNDLYTKEGLHVYLPYSTTDLDATSTAAPNGAIKLTSMLTNHTGHNADSFYLFFDEENKEDGRDGGTEFNITINDDLDGDVHVYDVNTGQADLEYRNSDDTVSWVASELGTKVERLVSSDKGQARITYSGGQTYAKIALTAADTTIGSSTGGVGVPVTDAESSKYAGKNLVVIGGSCVNTIAAELLGSSTPLCGADWTAATGVNAGQYLIQSFNRSGKIATLVAGFNAGDTDIAATALTTQTVDTTAGKKYTGTTADNLQPVITQA